MDTNARPIVVEEPAGYEARGKVCTSPLTPFKRLAGEFFFFGTAALIYLAFLMQATILDALLAL